MHYRIYLLASDEHIRHGYDVDCCTDADAFAEIAGVIGGFPAAELWCGTRCVGRWIPEETADHTNDWAQNRSALA
jgi:hypothetical protein